MPVKYLVGHDSQLFRSPSSFSDRSFLRLFPIFELKTRHTLNARTQCGGGEFTVLRQILDITADLPLDFTYVLHLSVFIVTHMLTHVWCAGRSMSNSELCFGLMRPLSTGGRKWLPAWDCRGGGGVGLGDWLRDPAKVVQCQIRHYRFIRRRLLKGSAGQGWNAKLVWNKYTPISEPPAG